MQKKLVLVYEELPREMLSAEERALLYQAEAAAGQAYAPYSGFPVGAAALLSDGRTFTGNNQENVALPSGTCAERSLLFYLGAQQLIPTVRMLAVYAPKSEGPVMPCGACRQVLYEYQQMCVQPWMLIFAGASERVYRFTGVNNLLPFAFVWRPS